MRTVAEELARDIGGTIRPGFRCLYVDGVGGRTIEVTARSVRLTRPADPAAYRRARRLLGAYAAAVECAVAS